MIRITSFTLKTQIMSKSLTKFSLLGSTNGTGNVITFVLLAAAATFGIGEDYVNSLVAAVGPIVLFVREIIEGTRKPRWVGNIATYLGSAIVLLMPALSGIIEAVKPIADAVASGNINMVWTLLIPLVNEILVYIRTRNGAGGPTGKTTFAS